MTFANKSNIIYSQIEILVSKYFFAVQILFILQ